MTTVTLTGKLTDVLSVPITDTTGYAVQLDTVINPVVSGTLNQVIVSEPIDIALAPDGSISYQLVVPDDNTNATYQLTVTKDGEVVVRIPFSVPLGATVLNLAELVGTTIQPNYLDTSVRRLASLIASDTTLLSIFGGGYRPRGEWDVAATYTYLDVVSYDGGSWVNLNRLPNTGITPGTDALTWAVVAERGLAGIGAGEGINTAYNAATWLADTTAPPTRSAVAGELEVLRDLADSKVAADDPTLTGTVIIPTNSTVGNFAASTQYVSDYAAPLVSPALTGSPTAPTLPLTANNNGIATTAFAQGLRPYNSGIYGVYTCTRTGLALSSDQNVLNGAIRISGDPAITILPAGIELPIQNRPVLVTLTIEVSKTTGANNLTRIQALFGDTPGTAIIRHRQYPNNTISSTLPIIFTVCYLLYPDGSPQNIIRAWVNCTAPSGTIDTFARLEVAQLA